MLRFDKNKLASYLRQLPAYGEINDAKAGDHSNLYWGQCLNDTYPLEALQVTGIASPIPIPIPDKDIKCIIEVPTNAAANAFVDSSKNNDLHSTCSLNSLTNLRISSICNNVGLPLLDVAILACQNILDLNVMNGEIEVNMLLTWLILCTPKENYHKRFSYNLENSGMFGKFILQIPVVGGYKGGKLKVGDSKNATFDFQPNSDKCFYAAAFFTDYKHEWQTVTRGNMVALEFDLLWKPASTFTTSSIRLPAFLSTVKLVKETLNAWSIANRQVKVDSSPNSSTSAISERASNTKDNAPEDLLIIPLEDAYCPTNFSFSALRGSDCHVAHILQSIDFIDVHLAIISSTGDSPESKRMDDVKDAISVPKDTESFKIVNWIYATNSVPQFQNYLLDFPKHFVINIQTTSVLKDNSEHSVRHPVLAIQPRHQSIHRCCIFQFDAILDHLESRLSLDGISRTNRVHLVTCLGQILSYCQEDPLDVWDVSDTKATERTLRLLKFCQVLQAQQEGLLLLSLFSQDVPKPNSDKFLNVGIHNDLVVRSMVAMVLNIGGWSVFSDSVIGMITPNRLLRYFKSFTSIVLVFLEHDCVQEAKDVAQEIFSAISSTFDVLQQLDQPLIDGYVDTIICLETFSTDRESVLERFLAPLFPHMTFYQQCCLLMDLQENSYRLTQSPSFVDILKRMCHIQLRRGLCNSTGVLEMVDEVVSFYINIGDRDILKMFVDSVFWRLNISGTGFNKNDWIEAVIKSAIASAVTKDVIIQSVKGQIDVEKVLALEPTARENNRRISLTRFFLFLLRLERSFHLADASRLELFAQVYQDMPSNRLENLVVDLLTKGSDITKGHPSSHALFFNLGCSLLDRNCSSLHQGPPLLPTVQILQFFVTHLNDSLAHQFIKQICTLDKWSPYSKNELIETILTSTDIWASDTWKTGTAPLLTALLTAWTSGLIQIMDSLPADPNAVEEKARYLRKNFASCFLVYIQNAKKDLTLDSDFFSSLLDKLTMHQLVCLMWDLHQSDKDPSLKKFHTTLNLYCDLCRRFMDSGEKIREWISGWKTKSTEMMMAETTNCILWLGDEKYLSLFSKIILDICPDSEPNVIITKIMSEKMFCVADCCPDIGNALCYVLEKRITAIAEIFAEADFQIPNISLPGHPSVQEYLRSSLREMTYENFQNWNEAVEFQALLCSCLSESGNPKRAAVEWKVPIKCTIVKVPQPAENCQLLFRNELMKEKSELEEFVRQKKQENEEDDTAGTSAKKRKQSNVIDVITLSD